MRKIFSRFVVGSKNFAALLIVLSAIVSGCATHPDVAAKKIDIGMKKGDVLELMGNPDHTDRVHGSDRWIYDATGERTNPIEIYFTDGLVAYFGKPAPKDMKVPKGVFKEVPAEKGFKPVPVEKSVRSASESPAPAATPTTPPAGK